jgi:hypothetical protein
MQMKFRSFQVCLALAATGLAVSMAAAATADSEIKAKDRPLEEWIQELSNEQFKVRERATRKIWEIGDEALPELEKASEGRDPEAAYRALALKRKIELFLTPETDPEVIKLVERYAKADAGEKKDLLGQMQRKRAWRQILKLFASETDAKLLKELQGSIDEIAVIAARECILNEDADGAREFLEMAPADPVGLLALADFHRSHGTLEDELERAKTLKGKSADEWQLALYRASGNIEAARDHATAAGESRISAAMSVLLGDPLPWLRRSIVNSQVERVQKAYTELAIKHWKGGGLNAMDLKGLEEALGSRSLNERLMAMNSLLLLGESRMVEESYIKTAPKDAFVYLESLERIPEALEALGLDPEKPDYTEWVEKRFSRLADEDEEDERAESRDTRDLILMANFMDRRGMRDEFKAAFDKPLAELVASDKSAFIDFLGLLFSDSGFSRLLPSGAPDLGKRLAYDWAGEDGARWEDLLMAAFGEDDEMTTVWHWMAELDPKASRSDRFDGLLAIKGLGNDPLHLRDKWLGLAWQELEKTPEDKRKDVFQKISLAIGMSPDVENNLKLWDLYPKEDRDGFFRNAHISELTIAGRWDEAASFFLDQISRVAKYKLNPRPSTHASAAACLRRAGRLDEAAAQDQWVEKLALGHDAYEIAIGYQFGDDFGSAARWFERALQQEEPSASSTYAYALDEHGEQMLRSGNWAAAAAVFEVEAQMVSTNGRATEVSASRLKLRLQADMARALAGLAADRAKSIALLEHCYQMFPGDGTLADYFFPSLRKAGLIKEHDAWFENSWDRMCDVVEKYPGSSNTLNTTGWLAARAVRNLDEAENFLKRALAVKPDQSAYLDTMAEIQFGKGDRKKALEWSTRAVNFTAGGNEEALDTSLIESFLLRRQHEHFRSDPLPD